MYKYVIDNYIDYILYLLTGTSPEFDMALYTLCLVARPAQKCKTRIGDVSQTIKTYDIRDKKGLQMASAYPYV